MYMTPCPIKRVLRSYSKEHQVVSELEFRDFYEAPKADAATVSASDGSMKKKGRTVAVTTDDMQKRRNDVKARTTLLLALPDEHQLRFSKYKTVHELWATILKTFGGNEATKKTKKNLLKQQYGNFKAEGSETLEQTFNRLQVIVSQLEFMDIEIEKDDLNQKFFTTKHSSGNEEVSTASTNVSLASANIGAASISQETACAYIPSQSNGSQIKFEDINQIDKDDMEEMDIKWNMALLSMRADRFWKKTGKKITIQGSDVAGFDKSKDWSFMGNEQKDHALVVDQEVPTEFAVMAKTSAKMRYLITLYVLNTESLNNKITDLDDKLFDSKNMLFHYKAGLAQVEGRIAEFKKQEIKFCEKIRGLELQVGFKNDRIESLTNELELLKKEKGELETKLTGFQSASKDLDSLLESQRLDKNNEGLGYSVIPPPLAQVYSPPKKDMSWTSLPEFEDDIVTDYSMPSPTIESTSDVVQNRNTSVTKTEPLLSTISPKPFIKFMKATDRSTKTKTAKVETAKPTVKYAAMYSKPSKSSKVRGNQRNWNNLKSYQLGTNFVMKKKACYNCGGINHLSYDYGKGVDHGSSWVKNNNTRKSMSPRPFIHRPYIPPIRPVRPNMNVAQPKRTSFHKPAHSYNKRPFQRTSVGNSQNHIDDKGYWDSGCSQHKTGNISYLTNYEPFDGGYVSFGHGGCKITGKGTIKIGKLEFENVYFVKDLKYNLFSVSQICDNKNSVLFTDLECIVLGQNFKLSDDANVLLRTLRQRNMYSIDLNNIVPHKDLTCLVVKASADECMQWCDNGGEFRNNEMNDFCSHKGIKREFSNARTPQQNGVAERRNKTLIKAARTMLADAKLPVTFWTEAVNTVCYVQNRVLVNKSHNKTPYELFNGRTPAIGFLKPFGCHVMILNTLDHLGKFEAKGDEGYFIRYSMSRKAFRVFNKRTKRVEENLHVDLLENKAIEKGAGPNCLFDIDYLTKSMNYVPVVDAEPSSDTRLISKRVVNQVKTPSLDNILTLTNQFEDILRVTTNSDESNGVEADVDVKSAFLYGTIDEEVDCFEKKLISVDHIHIDENVADLLTKPFDAGRFQYLVCKKISLLGQFSTVSVFLGFGLTFVGTSKYWGVLRILMISLRLIPLFWSTARIETTEERTKILATVDGKLRTVSESSIRRNLKLNDEADISSLSDAELFENLQLMGYNILPNQKFTFQKGQFSRQWKYLIHTIMQCLSPKSTGFNEFSSNIGTALVCLATIRVYNFSKMIFDGMVKNVNNKVSKFLMYPRFLSICLRMSQFRQITHTHTYVVPFHTRRLFTTLRVNNPSFSGRIVPLFDSMLVPQGKGSGTPTEPHHTPFPEAQQTSPTTHSSSLLPPVTTTTIPPVIPTESLPTVIPYDNPPLRQYTRRTRIAQSLVLPPVADKPASPLGDDSQGEACPTDSGFKADQDRANIAKTSTLPSDSTPRITYLAVDEGNMQHKLDELTALCTSLQRQQSEMVAKFEAQELEINSLKARIKMLEDKDRGVAEQSGDDAPIKGRRLDEGEEAAERVSDDTEEMATVLTFMDAASILTSGGVQVVPTGSKVTTATLSIPTGSGVVSTTSPTNPIAAPIFTTATESTLCTRRKDKETMVESETPKHKKIARDAKIARIHAEEEQQMMINSLDRSNETVVKYLQEYEQIPEDLSIGERIELISDLVKYQENYAQVLKYQTMQRKPRSKKQKKDYYMAVIKGHAGWKIKDFKGMSFEQIEAKFNTVWKQIKDFIPMGSKEEAKRFKRKGFRLEQESVKKLKTSEEVPEEVKSSEEVPEEKVKEMMQLVPVEEIYVEALQVKHLIIDWKHFDREDLNQLWALVKESLRNRPAISDKEKELWVELKRDQDIFMLIEKDYPLRKGLALVMICYKLQVENYSQMENDLILKIYKISNSPSDEFPLPEQLPTANEDKFPLLIQSDATAKELCAAAEVKE
nr:ribonuclease H-like domain-containing protein [Tanacetum cinerariifolium]